MDNYPDDIRNYDHDPRSPFYQEPLYTCRHCYQDCEAQDMRTEECCEDYAKEVEDGEN